MRRCREEKLKRHAVAVQDGTEDLELEMDCILRGLCVSAIVVALTGSISVWVMIARRKI